MSAIKDLTAVDVSYHRLLEITRAVTSTLSLAEVLQTVVNAIAQEVAGVDLVGYFEAIPSGGFVGKYANKVPLVPIPDALEPVPVPISNLLISLEKDAFAREIVETMSPVFINDAPNDARPDQQKIQLFDIKTCFGLPVHYEGELFGLVFLQDQGRPMELPPERRELLESFVAMAAVAIKNARLFEDEARLIKVTRELSSCHTSQDVIETCFRHVAEVSGAGICGIHLLRKSPLGRVLEPTFLKESPLLTYEEWQERYKTNGLIDVEQDAFFREVIETRCQLVIEDVDNDPRPDQKRVKEFGIKSIMGIPLVVGGECIGTITVPSMGKRMAFPAHVQRICKSIADSTAIALQNAHTAAHLEELVQLRTAEVSEANAKLEDLVAELRSLDRMKSDFVATVSHELRTPLHIIKQVVDLSLQGILGEFSELQKEYLGKMETQVKNLSNQVEDLLDLSKIESGSFQLTCTHASYSDIVAQAVSSLELAARKKDIEVTARVPQQLVLNVDRHRMEQVLLNLLSNAVKFTPEGGRIQVEVAEQGWGVVTSVRDTGIGIPERELERIFDKFYQINNTSTRRYGGTGLGLAITKNLVEMHGGTLGVESTEGLGSAFTFVLPRVPA
jgi:signal transduction histidine kinase